MHFGVAELENLFKAQQVFSRCFSMLTRAVKKSHFFLPSQPIFLTSFSSSMAIVELKARILGPSDLFLKSGSEITLICKLQQGPHDLGTIYWYKGKSMIYKLLRHCRVPHKIFSITLQEVT